MTYQTCILSPVPRVMTIMGIVTYFKDVERYVYFNDKPKKMHTIKKI